MPFLPYILSRIVDIFGVLDSNSIYNLCTTFLAKEEYLYLHVIMIRYGVNLKEKNFKVTMMNNEKNTTENLLIYTGTILLTRAIKIIYSK